jgi:hypothetical protein
VPFGQQQGHQVPIAHVLSVALKRLVLRG